jgi:arylsulfatase A-like enzyme/HEAT repeat protein
VRPDVASYVAPRLLPAVFTGLCFGLGEALVVGPGAAQLFLSIEEFVRYSLVAACLGVSAVLLLNRLGAVLFGSLPARADVRARAALFAFTLLAWPAFGRAVWLLTAGRRLADLPGRPWLVVFAALVAALLLGFSARSLVLLHWRLQPRAARRVFAGLLLLAVGALAADTYVLRRLYPALHVTLSAFACLSAAGASAFLRLRPRRAARALTWAGLGMLAGCAAPFLLQKVARAPNLAFAVEQSAPLSGKLLRALRPKATIASSIARRDRGNEADDAPAHARIDLRGRDVLLITIDALRADRLKAFGGRSGVTPVLDKLVDESVTFSRAYTQTPHTSYAIGSLLTGKYLRPVLSLPNAPREHVTLPRLLRRYGYRTAGFYPPAVFFVDEERFSALRDDHFGFEYVKEMFAKAAERVGQLERYLDGVDAGHPLLVWVHLFEPHEPYETHAEFPRGDEPEQRYDSEVMAADAAAGELIRLFRARRPNATVIVSADHGEEFGDHGGYHHGTTLFDEQVRVPLLWSSPGIAPPRVVSAPVELVDITTTLLGALQIPRDVRMRGVDLSGILAGAAPARSLRAFASTDELRMWTDGRWKAICETDSEHCRLFDLVNDPGERRDRGEDQPEILSALFGELSEMMASLPNVEAMALEGGTGWPEALARARLGDVSAGPGLLPLLADARADVRVEAARATAALNVVSAKSLLRSLRTQDADADVRAEAAIAALVLGDDSARDQVQQLFGVAREAGESKLDLTRRAALALAIADPEPVREVLLALVSDSSASEADRLRALRALGTRRDRQTVLTLIDLLEEVRLRPAIADALGQIGGRLAQDALVAALERERYAEARAAELSALLRLQDSRAKPLLLRMLGTETGVPGGLSLWRMAGGPFVGARGLLFDLRNRLQDAAAPGGAPGVSSARAFLHGAWECTEAGAGCRPGAGAAGETPARIELKGWLAPRGAVRFIADVSAADSGEFLEIAGQRNALRPGDSSLAISLAAQHTPRTIELRSSQGVRLRMFGVVPHEPDVAPPPPEPYDAGPSEEPDAVP